MKGFGESARNKIRQTLVKNGREIFANYGLKGATIRQLAKAAGISSGSFYSFYATKEALFLEILTAEIESARDRNLGEVLGSVSGREQRVRVFLRNALEDIRTNPILSRMALREEREQLERLFESEGAGERARADFSGALLPAIDRLRGGECSGERPEVLAGLVRSLFLLASRRQEIGEVYPQVMEHMTDCVAREFFRADSEG